MKFIIETNQKGEVLHDFSFHLIQAIGFCNWKYGETQHTYTLSDGKYDFDKDSIPVGSLQFVMTAMGNNVGKVTPLNVPEQLIENRFVKRAVKTRVSKNEVAEMQFPLFIKSADQYKSITDIFSSAGDIHTLPDGRYDVSEVVEIQFEWRVFVHQDRIVGVKHYSGEHLFPVIPDDEIVKDMVKTIEMSRYEGERFPLSYTLDVGVNQTGTFLIEAHPFVSCGLYGFADYQVLPSMFIQGYRFMQMQAGLL